MICYNADADVAEMWQCKCYTIKQYFDDSKGSNFSKANDYKKNASGVVILTVRAGKV